MIECENYTDVLDAIVEKFKASGLFARGMTVETGPAQISEGWLASHSIRNGGAVVACSRINRLKHHTNKVPVHELGLGVWFVPAPAKRKDQARALLDQVYKVVEFIDNNRFGIKGAGAPLGLSAHSMYSLSLEKAGSNLWRIEWTQGFHLHIPQPETFVFQGGHNAAA